MTNLRRTALLTFILSYSIFALSLILDSSDINSNYIFYVAWILGIVSAISNILLAEKININKWLTILFIISGILWIFPPLLITYFGIPCMILFLGIGIYIHIEALKLKGKKTA